VTNGFDNANLEAMCRSIKVLRNAERRATPEEISSAALQFVRKISGFHKPSKQNQEVFDRAVREISDASHRLLASLETSVRVPRPHSAPVADRSDAVN
jgi:hypothetical protein